MRIKIIDNNPPKDSFIPCSDISKYIGQEFDVVDKIENAMVIKIDGELLDIFEGEYEIIA